MLMLVLGGAGGVIVVTGDGGGGGEGVFGFVLAAADDSRVDVVDINANILLVYVLTHIGNSRNETAYSVFVWTK